ncbi:MAG: hypothetical protein HWE35_02225 [Rhodobacteraceae bacterium]|nr:hypothetical protein [Paracoccaceae bacterium]
MPEKNSSIEVDVEDLAQRFRKELEVITKHQLNFSTINVLLFSYGQLRQLGEQFASNPNQVPPGEMLLAHEALTTSVVASYGRLFTMGKGTTKLDPNKIPAEHKAAHDELMGLRHDRYAHNGSHVTTTTTVALSVENGAVIVRPEQTAGIYIGGADSWEPLFLWINRHLVENIHNYLTDLSRKSGIEWKMNEGPAPSWMDALFDADTKENGSKGEQSISTDV